MAFLFDRRTLGRAHLVVKPPLVRAYGIWDRWLVKRRIMAPFHAFVVLSPIKCPKGGDLEPGAGGSSAWVVVEATRD